LINNEAIKAPGRSWRLWDTAIPWQGEDARQYGVTMVRPRL